MRRAILVVACDRPDYFRLSLDHLSRCRGVSSWVIYSYVDAGGCVETNRLASSVEFTESHATFQRQRLGSRRNKVAGWDRVMSVADYAVIVEDDVLLSEDALEYHTWASERYRDDPQINSVTCYHRVDAIPPVSDHYRVHRRPFFCGWGAGLWRDRWERLRPWLDLSDTTPYVDSQIEALRAQRDLYEIYPLYSRAQNIGLRSSIDHGLSPEWYAENHRLKVWADGAMPPMEYHE